MIWMIHEGNILRVQVRHFRRILAYIIAGTPPDEAVDLFVPRSSYMGRVEANITGFDAARARACLDTYNAGLKTEVTSKPGRRKTAEELGVFLRVEITEREFASVLNDAHALDTVQKVGDANMWRSSMNGPVVAMVFYVGRDKTEPRYWLRAALVPRGVAVLEDEHGNTP